MKRAAFLAALACAALCHAQEGGLRPPAEQKQKGLVFTAPPEWTPGATVGNERGRWVLPKEEGQPKRLIAVLTRLGEKKGDAAAHAGRWAKGWRTADKKPIEPVPAPLPLEIEGVPAQVVELAGTYVVPPFAGAEDVAPKEGWAGLYALLEGPDGLWSVTLIGPAESVKKAKEAWLAVVKSAKVGIVETKDAVPDTAPPEEAGDGEGEKRKE